MPVSKPFQRLILAVLPDRAFSEFIYARKQRAKAKEQAVAFGQGLKADVQELTALVRDVFTP